MKFAGEIAALGTAVCWATGVNLFTFAGRRIGSMPLNRLRLAIACVFFAIALTVTHGAPWPAHATAPAAALLALSGLIGFVFGDSFTFRSLVILGPGRAALLSSLGPLFTAAIAWPVLHERPGPLMLLGMALTLGGISWVLRARARDEHVAVEGSALVGVISGVLGALGQGGGYVLSKMALREGLDPLSATAIRVGAAAIAIWTLAAFRREVRPTLAALADRRAALFVVAGAFCGLFLGVTLSLAALQFIEAGVAASITACYPLLAILMSARFHGERLTLAYAFGAVLTVAGVVVLVLR